MRNHSLVRPPKSNPGSPTNVTFNFFFRSNLFLAICKHKKKLSMLNRSQGKTKMTPQISSWWPTLIEVFLCGLISEIHICLFYFDSCRMYQLTSERESATIFLLFTLRLRNRPSRSGACLCCTCFTIVFCGDKRTECMVGQKYFMILMNSFQAWGFPL